jgi:hypothetical protein
MLTAGSTAEVSERLEQCWAVAELNVGRRWEGKDDVISVPNLRMSQLPENVW